MRRIDMLVEAFEKEGVGRTPHLKRRKLFTGEGSTSAVQVYQGLERSIVPKRTYSFSFEELAVLSRDEVFPFLNTSRLEEGIVTISGNVFLRGTSSENLREYPMDISTEGLRGKINFPAYGECKRTVDPVEIESEFLKRTGHKYKKDAWKAIAQWFQFSLKNAQARSEGWVIDNFKKYTLEGHTDRDILDKRVRLVIAQVLRVIGKSSVSFCSSTVVLLAVAHVDPGMAHFRPDWHMWVSQEIKSRLTHEKRDPTSAARFREGWLAIIGIVMKDFLAKQARSTRREPLLLPEARNAFADTRAEWDNEKGDLVHERDLLQEELNKAKEAAVEAEEREMALRREKDTLQLQHRKEKAELEARNAMLLEEVGQLQEEKKRNADKEEAVQGELAQIRQLMQAATKRSEQTPDLKKELEAKELELKTLQDDASQIRQRLKEAKKRATELEGELKKMPAGIILKGDSRTLELMRSGKKWHISCYPQLFHSTDLTQWTGNQVVPEVCTFCKGLISPGCDIRIPTCGHSYHVSCVCSSFGLNYLVCWNETCKDTLPNSWVKEFCLDREVNLEALEERYCYSWDVRSMAPSALTSELEEDFEVAGVPSMGARKKEYLESLTDTLAAKTKKAVHNHKGTRRVYFTSPIHRVPGNQFQLWSPVDGGLGVSDWGLLWGYPSTKYWVFSRRVPPHETGYHNRCLVTSVDVDVPSYWSLLQALCDLNSALCIRLRPGDGIFLESFAQALVVIPWAAKCLGILFRKEFVTIWRTGHMPLEALQSRDSYRPDHAYEVLSSLFSDSAVWHCDHASTSETAEDPEPHQCSSPPSMPPDTCLWLALRL
ncbi:hypothetical protein R1sor_012470 [Riccia sorocarpa]|uniref:RING-type domain-containing protein n=1 Tax=Riccia sorocarpa TaxID=122646 RepID=A0ABD3I5R4_9MARC